MTSKQATVASFIESAPPGELSSVVADIKALASNELQHVDHSFKKYNEQQYSVVKLPESQDSVLISAYNSLGGGRYFDTASETSFHVDHKSQKTSQPQPHPLSSKHAALIRALENAIAKATAEHFPSRTTGIHPVNDDAAIVMVLAANKYSPQNFWNGRWQSTYTIDPTTFAAKGVIKVDVHYYEDGNVRMISSKQVEFAADNAEAIAREISKAENRYQEELNRGFVALAEGSFKGLRRQLPVTRQKVEWEKIGGYRLGQDVAGGRQR